jgi:mannose-6-phosphate isomerase class I
MDLSGFNAENVEPNAPRDPIPAGWYRAVIEASEEKPTKAQTGSYLQLTIQIIEGDHAGRKVIDRLNLNNPNATAVEIAQRTLSSICRAVGIMTPRDSQDLHDKPMMVKVKVKPGDANYGPSNEVDDYAPVEAKAAPATASGGSTPPWKR